ncbi:MAG TPA: polyprenyl diphosphate synthase [Solirubrobacteraceae bacterium]|jgi:undecaprenyl diphosphate synthase|nr:polyprenyl diphosphate synthase [Solirubrobacteraceae bacterium]
MAALETEERQESEDMPEDSYPPLLDTPKHIACIMDGNGRWATQRGLARVKGHAAAEQATLSVIHGAIDVGIGWLTLYTFSTENWNRPAPERNYLIRLIGDVIDRRGRAFHARNIRIRSMGRRDRRISKNVWARIDAMEDLTRDNTGMTLTFAFNYGGRAEIVDAAAKLARSQAPITDESLAEAMYFPDVPDPDLVLRFGGERRLSNFMLWHIAYAELDFIDVLWPDARDRDLVEAVARYRQRSRRFGGLASAVSRR